MMNNSNGCLEECGSYKIPQSVSWDANPNNKKENHFIVDENIIEVLLKDGNCEKLENAWSKFWSNKTFSQCRLIASSTFIVKLFEKLCDPNKTWMPSFISKIINTGTISSRVCPGLIEAILSHKDLCLLDEFLSHVNDISEKDIVRCLNFLVPSENTSLSSELDDRLFILIRLPYTENVLVEEIQHLQFDHVLVLLNYICAKLKTDNVLIQSNIGLLLSWACVLLDAHYSQIIIYSEAWQTLLELQEILAVQMELYKDLFEVDVVLTKIKQSRDIKLTSSKHVPYQIEVMSI